MREEDIGRALETLGLTGKEGRAYLGLVRNGVSTAQEVSQILCVSPFPVAPEILHLLFDALGRSRRLVRVVLNESNRSDLAELSGLLGRTTRVQFHFPARPLSTTRLAHTYVFPSDQEVFILN